MASSDTRGTHWGTHWGTHRGTHRGINTCTGIFGSGNKSNSNKCLIFVHLIKLIFFPFFFCSYVLLFVFFEGTEKTRVNKTHNLQVNELKWNEIKANTLTQSNHLFNVLYANLLSKQIICYLRICKKITITFKTLKCSF